MRGKMLILLFLLFSVSRGGAQASGRFVVLELFTSEGCSSCPPADQAFLDIAKSNTRDIYLLEFHVDYWNSLGWQDPFSSADYSRRQNNYGRQFQLNSIYTPQVIVNGKTEFTGSDKDRLVKSIAEELKGNAPTQNISLSVKPADRNKIAISYLTNASSENTVNIALVQLLAQSRVRRGENEGKILQHTHIVRDFRTMDEKTGKGSLVLTLPAGINAKDCKLIGFLQSKKNGQILGATENEIP